MNKIYRSQTNKLLTGTLGGIAEYFHINAQIIRILFVILSIWPGHLIFGLLAYVVCLVFISNKDDDHNNGRRNLTDVDEYDNK